MNWEPFFVLWPRRIEGEWCWLSWQERRVSADYFGGYYGGNGWSYVYRIDTGDESVHHYTRGGDLG